MQNLYDASYSSYQLALHACANQGYQNSDLVKLMVAKNIRYRESISAHRSINFANLNELRPIIAIGALQPSPVLRVIDFGGGGGEHYAIVRTILGENRQLYWNVVETPAMAEAANKKLAGGGLKFFDTIEGAAADLGHVNLVFTNGALQYTPEPLAFLRMLLAVRADHLFITRTAFSTGNEKFITIQTSLLSANGPPGPLPYNFNDYTVRYPVVFTSKQQAEELIEADYHIRFFTTEEKSRYKSKSQSFDYYGYFCDLKNRQPSFSEDAILVGTATDRNNDSGECCSMAASDQFFVHNIELTNHCLMKCVMCPRTYAMDRPQGFMRLDGFRKVIDELAQIPAYQRGERQIWLHHFGESLMHPFFGKFIRYCTDSRVKAKLSLNPFVLTRERSEKLIAAEPELLYLSLDGHDDDSFAKIRGLPNAFNISKTNILDFLKLKYQYGSKIKVAISVIDLQLNEESIKRTRDFWMNQIGVDDFLIKPFVTWNGDIDEINNMQPGTIHKATKHIKCRVPWQSMTVTWDGDVVPCCFDYNKKYVLGNIYNNTLCEIWNDKPINMLRNEFLSENITNALCANCSELR